MNKRKCSIANCTNTIKHANGIYCAKHYERVRVHGSPFVTKHYDKRVAFVKCKVDDCTSEATHKGQMLCMLHYGRWSRHGDTNSRLPTYGQGVHYHEQGYKMILHNGKYVMEHIFLAEKALGKPLPEKAVVHHMNGNVLDNLTPFNLVICPDQSYHMLLHRRMKELNSRIILEELEKNDD